MRYHRHHHHSHHPHVVYPVQPGSSDPQHPNQHPQSVAAPVSQRIGHQQSSQRDPNAQRRPRHGYSRPSIPPSADVIDLTGEDDCPRQHHPPSLPRLTERESPFPNSELRLPKEVPHRSMTTSRSTGSSRFEELTGGRLPSPPPQKTMPILSFGSENRSFKSPSLQEKQKSPNRRDAVSPHNNVSWNSELGAPRLGTHHVPARESPKSPESASKVSRNATPSSMPTDRPKTLTNGTSRSPVASPSGVKAARKNTPAHELAADKVVTPSKSPLPEKSIPIQPGTEPAAPSRPEFKPKVPLELGAFMNILRESFKTLHSEHEHRTKIILGRARRSIERNITDSQNTQIEGDGSAQQKKKSGSFIQKESPFAKLRPLPVAPANSPTIQSRKRIKLGQCFPRVYSKAGHDITQCYDSKIYHDDSVAIPRFTTYISTRRNVLIEDNKTRAFLPYHGEKFLIGDDHDYARMEHKIIHNQKNFHHLNAISEKANFYSSHAYQLLERVGTDIAAVLYYLLDEKNVSAPPNLTTEHSIIWSNREAHLTAGYYEEDDDSDSARQRKSSRKARPKRDWKLLFNELEEPRTYREKVAACLACEAFLKMTGISLWHVIRQSSYAQDAEYRKSMRLRRVSSSPQENVSDPDAMSTYKELVCFVCQAHECPSHGEFEDEEHVKNIRIRVNYKPYSPKSPSLRGLDERVNIDRLDLDNPKPSDIIGKDSDGGVSGLFWARLKTEEGLFGDQEECSQDCFWPKKNRHERTAGDWSKEESKVLDMLRGAYENDRRGPCLLAQSGILNKTCVEIFFQLLSTAPNETLLLLRARNEVQAAGSRMPPRKDYNYWLENSKTYLLHERQPFTPCNHLGPCNASTNCDCFKQDITCEKSCACADSCARRFRGCQCAARGKPCRSNEKCDCWRLNRECDPDLCRTCGSHEVLDPANRYNPEVTAGKCLNVHIQRGVPKMTVLGQSKMMLSGNIQGWGLYMGQTCKKGDFIGEYVGEIVTRREAEQRGTIYDKRNMSYLFDLNDSQTLDSTFVGNKHRFINHQREPFANCAARTTFCNSVQRIGMFACKDIEIGDEIFFDYGEGFASKFDLIKMNAEGPPTIQKPADPFLSRSGKLYRQQKCTLSKNGIRIGRPPKWNEKESSKSKKARKRRHSEAIYDGPNDYMDEDEDIISSSEEGAMEIDRIVRDSNSSDSSDGGDDDTDKEEITVHRKRRRLLSSPRKPGSLLSKPGGSNSRKASKPGAKSVVFETPQKRGWRTREKNLKLALARGENVNKRGRLPGSIKKRSKNRGGLLKKRSGGGGASGRRF